MFLTYIIENLTNMLKYIKICVIIVILQVDSEDDVNLLDKLLDTVPPDNGLN